MCGIIAVLGREGRIEEAQTSAALRRLSHRGPDGDGLWIAADRSVALGHTRLAIMDPEGGAQPMFSEDRATVAVVNGEFYGFEAIRDRLIDEGHRFMSRSDSEIAVHLLEDDGRSGLSELRGEFAFVLYNASRQELIAVRDRVGTKPLFYATHDGALLIASEVKSLFELGLPCEWDMEVVGDYSAYQVTEMGRGLFRNVRQVPPGHFLRVGRGGHELHRYWDHAYRERDDQRPCTLEECVRAIEHELSEAVRLRLRADTRVGCYLSGGLDSGLILGLAARHGASNLQAFTMGFREPHFDESSLAKETAEHFGASHEVVEIGTDILASGFEDAVWHAEHFLWNTNAMAKSHLSRAVRGTGYKVILSGQGSDEIFGGYGFFELDHHQPIRSAEHVVGDRLRTSLDRVLGRLGYIPAVMSYQTAVGAQLSGLLTAEFRAEALERDANMLFLESLPATEALSTWDRLATSSYLWNKSALVDYILSSVGDRAEMANSVESRLPFLDHHVIALADDMPTDCKIGPASSKVVLRAAARSVLPAQLRDRPKVPFFSPRLALDRSGRFTTKLFDLIHGPIPSFFDRKAIEAFAQDATDAFERAGRPVDDPRFRAADHALMFVASMCVIEKSFIGAAWGSRPR